MSLSMPLRSILAILAIAIPSSGYALQIVNVDITPNVTFGAVANNLPGVIGKASDVTWNAVGSTDLQSSLLDENGEISPVGFQLTGTSGATTTTGIGDVADAGVFAFSTSSSGNFFATYAYAHGGGNPGTEDFSTFEISGLGSGTVIPEIILYATWEYVEAGTEFRLSSDGGATFTDYKLSDNNPSEDNAAFSEGNSYVRFTDIAAHTDGSIIGEWKTTLGGGSIRHRGPFNGLQISTPFDPPVPALLTLQVDSNGQMRIVNDSDEIIDIDYISISSVDIEEDGGSLNPTGFDGIGSNPGYPVGNNDGSGWEQADNNSDTDLVESFLHGSSSLNLMDYVHLGAGFVPGSVQDLEFTYHVAGSTEGTVGIVEYVADLGLAGDFNDDGQVDAADYTVWRDNLGTSNSLSGNGTESGASAGVVDQDDFNLWVSRFGQSSASSTAAAVPEPSALILLATAFVACYCSARQSDCE